MQLQPSRRILSGLLPVERLLFASDVVCVGSFRCAPGDPLFAGGRPSTAHCIAFPRTAVEIQHEGGPRFLADASVTTLYNRGQAYRRWQVAAAGDRADWLAFPDDVIRDAVRELDPRDAERRHPLRHPYAPADARLYLSQRRCFDGSESDPLAVEELALRLLNHVVRRAYAAHGRAVRPRAAASADAVEQVRLRLARSPEQRVSLRALAREVSLSPWQLSRAFRAHTGMTLTEYRMQLRLRAALEPVAMGRDLTSVALDHGFSSHSHFTSAFRRAFGVVPRELRARS